jgi:hypothetical protein
MFAISRPTLFGGREEFLLQYPARLEPPTKRDLARHRFTVRHGKKRRSFQAPDAATFDAWLSALEKALEPKRGSEHVPTPSTTTSTATTATTSHGRSSNAGSNATNSVGRVSSAGSSAPKSTRRRASSAARAPALRLTLERPCFRRDPTNSKLIRLHRPAPTIAGATAAETGRAAEAAEAGNNDVEDGGESAAGNVSETSKDEQPDADDFDNSEEANAAEAGEDVAVNAEEEQASTEDATFEEVEPQLMRASARDSEPDVHGDSDDLNALTIRLDQQEATSDSPLAGEDATTFITADDESPVLPELAVQVSDESVAVQDRSDVALVSGAAVAIASTVCTNRKGEDTLSEVEAVLEAIVAAVEREERLPRDTSGGETAGVDPEVKATVEALVPAAVESASDSERGLGAATNGSTAGIDRIDSEVRSVIEARVSAVVQAERETRLDVSSSQAVAAVLEPSGSRSSTKATKSSTRPATLAAKHMWVPLDPTNSRLIWVRYSIEADAKSAPHSNSRGRAIVPAKRWLPVDPNSTRLIWIRRVETAAARKASRYKATSSTRKWVPLDPVNSRLLWVRRQVVPAGGVATPIVDSSSSRLYPFRHGQQRRHWPARC